MAIRVIVSGAGGKMGREVVRAVRGAADMELVAAVDPSYAGRDAGELAGLGFTGVPVSGSLAEALARDGAHGAWLVEFTAPDAGDGNVRQGVEGGGRGVGGATGRADTGRGQSR